MANSPTRKVDFELAKMRGNAIIRFVQAQMDHFSSTEAGVGTLAAGKIFELVRDTGHASDMYDLSYKANSSLEVRARMLMNDIKGGLRQDVVQRAEGLVAEFPEGTYPNLVTEEPISLFNLLGTAQSAENQPVAALASWRKAAQLGDKFAQNNLGMERAGKLNPQLPKFISRGTGRMIPGE